MIPTSDFQGIHSFDDIETLGALSLSTLTSVSGSLSVNLEVKDKLVGSFKTSHKGSIMVDRTLLSIPSLTDSDLLCVKQLYRRLPNGPIRRSRGSDEAMALFRECHCLYFASILLELTYKYIDQMMVELGAPQFTIPRLRFVNTLLAISDDKEKTFLVEEWIDAMDGSQFTKYINNGNPVPCLPDDAPKSSHEIADFLCFVQHLQWRMTGYTMFTSDFQGILYPSVPPQFVIVF
jgi:hypothetical protein